MAEVVTGSDGRTLAFLEVGAPDGPLVLHNHGGPGSRLEALLLAGAAATNRIRLICVDRSGMGLSSPAQYLSKIDALGAPSRCASSPDSG